MSECQEHIKEPCTRKVSIFQPLSHDELVKIASMTIHKQFQKGQVLIHEGEQSDTLYIIHTGQVKLSKMTLQGKEQILRILASGEFFGELNIFETNEVSNFSAYATEDTEICMLTKEKMNQIMGENPGIAMKLLAEVAKRLAHAENLAQNLATKNPEVRIANMILEFCEKYGIDQKDGIVIQLPLTREEMANYIGITRETMSRKLHLLENHGIIVLKGNKQLIVKDEEALRAYMG